MSDVVARVRRVLLAFPCPTCGRKLRVTGDFTLPAHTRCDTHGLTVGLFDDGLAAIPAARRQGAVERDAAQRLRRLMSENPGGQSERASTSVVARSPGQRWDVSGGLPGLGKRT